MPDLDGLRILAFCDYFSPMSPGGSERVAAEVYSRMAAWGAHITVVSAVPRKLTVKAPTDWASPVEVVSVPAWDVSRYVGAQLAVSGRLYRVARAAMQQARPAVITAQSLHFQGSVVAALLAARRTAPLVTTVHVAGTDDLPLRVRLPTNAYEASVGRFILDRSERVIAVSDAVRGHLDGKVDPGRVVTVSNGVDTIRFAPAQVARREAAPVVVFVGRLIENKGPDLLVDALGILAERGVSFRAMFVGDGPLRAVLEARVSDLGLSPRVSFTGTVMDVRDVLRTAEIFVRPSKSEGMSLALLEAMASGLCVVASGIPANAALVDDGRSGLLFGDHDAHGLAAVLGRALGDNSLRSRLGLAARNTALTFSWEDCARHTAAVLSEVASALGRRGMPHHGGS